MTDYYRRFVDTDPGEAKSMRVLHITTFVWGMAGTGMALAMISVKSALDAWWSLAGIFGGGTLGLFLLGMLGRRAGNASAVIAVCVGVPVIVWMALSPKWTTVFPEAIRNPLHDSLTIVLGTALVVLVGFAAALILNHRGTKAQRINP
jgi:SSS family solute:Na+ symporter